MKRIIPERTGLNLSILNIIMALNKEKIQEQITIKEESIMITWKNLDTLDSFKELSQTYMFVKAFLILLYRYV